MSFSTFSDKLTPEQVAMIPFFNGLEDDELQDLSGFLKVRKFTKAQCVIAEGDKAESMYFILEGSVQIHKQSYEGSNELIGTLSKPEFFGEMVFLDGEARSASIVAESDMVVAELLWENFQQAFSHKPELIIYVLINIAKTLSLRLRNSNALYANLVQNLRNISMLV